MSEKEISVFKPVKLSFKTDLVSHPACLEWLGKLHSIVCKKKLTENNYTKNVNISIQ